jgi:hypothetical protein
MPKEQPKETCDGRLSIKVLDPTLTEGLARPKQPAAVLVTVKDKSLRDGVPGGPPSLTVTARVGDRDGRSGRGDGRQSAEPGDGDRMK